MTHVCPEGHYSEEEDYCSECGKAMAATPIAAQSAPQAIVNNDVCPDCATPRTGQDRYCEVCRYDFDAGQSFGATALPISTANNSAPAVPVVQATVQPITVSAVPPQAHKLQLRIVVDNSLNTDPDPDHPCPVGVQDKIFHLDLSENTLGRQYEGKGVCPEIVVHDPGISRRHLKFIRDSDGIFSVLELGSSNGTALNGNSLEPGIVTVVQPKDELVLGMWTRIFIESR